MPGRCDRFSCVFLQVLDAWRSIGWKSVRAHQRRGMTSIATRGQVSFELVSAYPEAFACPPMHFGAGEAIAEEGLLAA